MNFPYLEEKDLDFLFVLLDLYLERSEDAGAIKRTVKIIDKLRTTS